MLSPVEPIRSHASTCLQRLLIGQPVIRVDDDQGRLGQATVAKKLLAVGEGNRLVGWECRMTVLGFTVLAVPHRFHAGHNKTNGVSPLSMFMATAPPRELPTTTSG